LHFVDVPHVVVVVEAHRPGRQKGADQGEGDKCSKGCKSGGSSETDADRVGADRQGDEKKRYGREDIAEVIEGRRVARVEYEQVREEEGRSSEQREKVLA
jgi:hypothetical protein